MKISKILSIVAFSGALFIGQNSFGQDKEMADKMDKKKEDKMKVDKSMKPDAAPVMVGGAKMFGTRTILDNASMSNDHTTLVAAIRAGDLVETLKSDGPFTVFAPTNAAFDKLPEGKVDELLKPENKVMLQTVLKYHVISGEYTSSDLLKLIEENDGKAILTTVEGGMLSAWTKDDKIYITDENANTAEVTIADVDQSNGVIHVVDSVIIPKS